MAALSDLAPKLAKLIPMLGSNHDGEIVGTAKAIRRTLESGGLDLHALAAAIGEPPEPVVIYRTAPTPAEPSRSHQTDARRCLQSGIAWTTRERDFLRDMAERRGRLTEKQQAWLDALGDRVTRHKRSEPEVDF